LRLQRPLQRFKYLDIRDWGVAEATAKPEGEINACPCCGMLFASPMPGKERHSCAPPPVGCGASFTVVVHAGGNQ